MDSALLFSIVSRSILRIPCIPAAVVLFGTSWCRSRRRCSFSHRRTAWCICGMFRATAPRAPPMRCKTGQQTCAHAPQCPTDLGLGLLTPGPHGKSEDDDDWGEWTHSGRRSHEDRRPPGRHAAASNSNPTHTVDLIQLRVRAPTPSLGSHHFVLRSGFQVEEIAIRINDVLYYTLPELVYPDPSKWKQSWETVCRSVMPHRENIIRDEHRVRSVLELTAERLPQELGPRRSSSLTSL